MRSQFQLASRASGRMLFVFAIFERRGIEPRNEMQLGVLSGVAVKICAYITELKQRLSESFRFRPWAPSPCSPLAPSPLSLPSMAIKGPLMAGVLNFDGLGRPAQRARSA